MTKTDLQVKAFIAMAEALGEAIKGLGSVPSGHLFAHVMGVMSLETYEKIINLLISAGHVKKSGHVLTWIGN